MQCLRIPIYFGSFVTFMVLPMLTFLGDETEATFMDQPVIGVLGHSSKLEIKNYGNGYILGTYAKFLESAGAIVIIVEADQPDDYYVDIFSRINGVLIPGGGSDLITSSFARSSRILYSLALEANDNGDYFPIWGTCLGFQMLTVLTAKKNLLELTDSRNISLPLSLDPSYKESRIFQNASEDIINYLTNENITTHYHLMSLLTETYRQQPSLNQFYRVTSYSKGRDDFEFVSSFESYKYPIYGVIFHPEKNLFNINPDLDISHSAHAVVSSQYFANFFVNEARKNSHKFEPIAGKLSIDPDAGHNIVCLPRNEVQELFAERKKKNEEEQWMKLCKSRCDDTPLHDETNVANFINFPSFVNMFCIGLCVAYILHKMVRGWMDGLIYFIYRWTNRFRCHI